MAADTFIVLAGVYDSVDDATADYEAVKSLHKDAGLIDAYDAALIERRDDGKVKILKKAASVSKTKAIGGGIWAATTGGGAQRGAVAGHAAAGMSRGDLKELGEQLDAGQAGLIVVGVSDMDAKIKAAMKQSKKLEEKQLKADAEALEKDAKEATA